LRRRGHYGTRQPPRRLSGGRGTDFRVPPKTYLAHGKKQSEPHSGRGGLQGAGAGSWRGAGNFRGAGPPFKPGAGPKGPTSPGPSNGGHTNHTGGPGAIGGLLYGRPAAWGGGGQGKIFSWTHQPHVIFNRPGGTHESGLRPGAGGRRCHKRGARGGGSPNKGFTLLTRAGTKPGGVGGGGGAGGHPGKDGKDFPISKKPLVPRRVRGAGAKPKKNGARAGSRGRSPLVQKKTRRHRGGFSKKAGRFRRGAMGREAAGLGPGLKPQKQKRPREPGVARTTVLALGAVGDGGRLGTGGFGAGVRGRKGEGDQIFEPGPFGLRIFIRFTRGAGTKWLVFSGAHGGGAETGLVVGGRGRGGPQEWGGERGGQQ